MQRRSTEHALVLLAPRVVDPGLEGVATRSAEQLTQGSVVLQGNRVPACRFEHGPDAPDGNVGNDPVKRLSVYVDHPQDVIKVRNHRG